MNKFFALLRLFNESKFNRKDLRSTLTFVVIFVAIYSLLAEKNDIYASPLILIKLFPITYLVFVNKMLGVHNEQKKQFIDKFYIKRITLNLVSFLSDILSFLPKVLFIAISLSLYIIKVFSYKEARL